LNTTELIAIVRRNCMLEDGAVDYTDTVILRELTDALTTKFERYVLDAKANYWIHNFDIALTSGQDSYRLPTRAIGVSKVELAGPSPAATGWARLPQVSENNINYFQSPIQSIDQPQRWLLRGDSVVLDPCPASGFNLRIWYYVKPSRLTPVQAIGNISAVVLGPTPQIQYDSVPLGYNSAGSSFALTTSTPIDVLSTGSWHELKLVNQLAASVGGASMNFPVGTDLSDVQVGDLVRGGDNTEFPQIPEDYHRTLADIASVKILIQRDFQNKALGYAQDANADIQRFANMISQRVQEESFTHRATLPSLQLGRYWGGYGR
jgi:hypothetical protein